MPNIKIAVLVGSDRQRRNAEERLMGVLVMGRDAYISFRGAAGAIVMNTDAELEQAYAELRNGTFVKQRDQWDGTLRRSREDERMQ